VTSVVRYFISGSILLLLWEILPAAFGIPSFMLPKLSEVVAGIARNWPIMSINLAISSFAVAVSFAISVAIATALACVVHVSPQARSGLEPFILISQLFPRVALAPFILMWFGLGFQSKVAIAVLIGFFPIYEGLRTGLARADANLIMQARLLGYSRVWRLFLIEFPMATPHLFVGLRTASLFVVVGVIVAEFLATGDGVGLRIVDDMGRGETAAAFGYVLIVALAGSLFYASVALTERLILTRLHLNARTTQ
jgi:NitT/TauT family transport system permease protein